MTIVTLYNKNDNRKKSFFLQPIIDFQKHTILTSREVTISSCCIFDYLVCVKKQSKLCCLVINVGLSVLLQNRIWQRDCRDVKALQPDASYNYLVSQQCADGQIVV